MDTYTLVLVETPESREATVSQLAQENSRTLQYKLSGIGDEALVTAILDARLPLTHPVTGYPRKEYTLKAEADGTVWDVKVNYGRMPSEYKHSFGVSKAKIQLARRVIADYPRLNKTPMDRGKLIGIADDRVEGVEIETRRTTFSERHGFARAQITGAYLEQIELLVASTNNAVFRGRQIGEVKFMGAELSYNDADQRVWVDFSFEVSKNEIVFIPGLAAYNPTLRVWVQENGPYTGDGLGVYVAKPGWAYLWVRYIQEPDANTRSILRKAYSAHLDEVFAPSDFSLLGIGTT